MAIDLTADAIVRGGSGFLLFALGIFVIAVGQRRRANAAFGIYLASYGALFLFQNLIDRTTRNIFGFDALSFEHAGSVALYAVMISALCGMIVEFPAGQNGRERRRALAACIAAGLIALVVSVLVRRSEFGALAVGAAALSATWLALLLAWLVTLAARFPGLPAAERKPIAFLALGLSMYPAYKAGFDLAPLRWSADNALAYRAPILLSLALLTLYIVLWLRNSAHSDAMRRLARNTALAPPFVAFAAMLLGSLVDPNDPDTTGGIGVARVVGAAFVAWAVLRHDLLGVGLRGRTIRRGTVATAALASLLIVAQVAQNFLSARYGLIMGGIVAGALIFAASPIQRAIETRDRRHAVPIATTNADRATELYRSTLRRYLRDGTLTREEERHLAHLAGELRIDAGHAFELREQVEREMQEGGR